MGDEDATLTFDVGSLTDEWTTAAILIISLAVMMLLLLWLYHTLQRPRLFLTYDEQTREPTLTWQSLVRYLVLTPIVLTICYTVIMMVILIGTSARGGLALILSTTIFIGTSRLLAHVNFEAAHELAKTVPLLVLSLVFISGIARPLDSVDTVVGELDGLAGLGNSYLLFLIVLDFAITAIWYFRQRSRWKGTQAGSHRYLWRRENRERKQRIRGVLNFGIPSQNQRGDVDDH